MFKREVYLTLSLNLNSAFYTLCCTVFLNMRHEPQPISGFFISPPEKYALGQRENQLLKRLCGQATQPKLFKLWALFWITCLVICWTSFAKNREILKGASLDSWYSLRRIFCIAVEEGKQYLYYSILYSYESVFTINLLYYGKGLRVILLNPWNR